MLSTFKKYSAFSVWKALLVVAALTAHEVQPLQADQAEESNVKPNVVFILADDMGYGDIGAFGQKTLATPNLDRMASQGLRMMQHFSGSTVCAPSRCVLMTGRHTGNASVRGNTAVLMPDDELTVARLFKQNGYRTGCFGKWGIGHPPPYDDPQRKGFDEFYGYINMWHAHNFWPEFLIENGRKIYLENEVLDQYDQPVDKEGRGVATVKKEYAPDLIATKALNFIDENRDRPFFLYLALNMPHANNEAGSDPAAGHDGMEVPDHGQFSDRPWPQPEKGFARMIELIDGYTGRVLDSLVSHGIERKTLVIFTSDNGPHQEGRHQMEFFDSNGQLRGMKRDLYEGGLRVPMIAWWPGTIRSGGVSQHISGFQDFLPTAAELVGAQVPDCDGISYLPTLTGDVENQRHHPYLYWEFHERGGKQALLMDHFKAVRMNVLTAGESAFELYDLRNDVREEINVASRFPRMVEEMGQIMDREQSNELARR
jgi:arylsulfatase A-like enzyme